jgi:hypothetical protein
MADTAASPPDANGGSIIDNTKANAAAAINAVSSGPVMQNVRDHSAKVSSEFSNLAASRTTPQTPAATGQPLTHYHSFFYELLSWKNPRASGIALISTITSIFITRYIDIPRLALWLSWVVLGTTVAAEVAGKFVLNAGLTSQIRPRQYFTLSRETLESLTGDVHELVNFFIIEVQRIVFVENVAASLAAAIFAFISYHLTKLVPYWGLAVISTVVAFVAPLVYVTNKELIDHHLKNASDVVDAQTTQIKTVAQQQVDQVATIGKQYAGDYTGKVQDLLRNRGSSPKAEKKQQFPSPPVDEPKKVDADLPSVPQEPVGAESEAPLAS